MSAPRRNPPDTVRDTQARASHPETSIFVSANAGSGKTYVLVNRVIRLLLQGVSPEKILCITFTKAAAANMAERVFTKLGQWVRLSDSELDQQIRDVGESKPDSKTRARARKLFANALETPGGLKVQTIHALCTRLLQQFPFESKVPAHFAVLDERDQDEMMERANLSVLLEAARLPESEMGRALQTAMTMAADVTFQDVVREACLTNRHFVAWSDNAGSNDEALAQLSKVLGVGSQDHAHDVAREMIDGPHLPRSEWPSVAATLESGSKTDASQAECLREAFAQSGEEQIASYLGFFLTGTGTPRKSLMTKPLVKEHPALATLLDQEQARILQLNETRRAIIQRDRTFALIVIARAVSNHYRREKGERGLLDYDDLIDKTLALLSDGASGWVHFKLDRGIDHVLIDEAQDTSPKQWDIVQHLIEEFWSGAGARDGVKRTLFAVGDEKQSIFSFQGAAAREFDLRRRAFEKRFRDAKQDFEKILFNHSFRSGGAILHAVDKVFVDPSIYRSIHGVENAEPKHFALADAAPALIDLWKPEEPPEAETAIGWKAPLDATPETSQEVRLARRVQAEIEWLIDAKTLTGSEGRRRRLSYGDILILVRRRGTAFNAVIQALKHARIPVAGADRLKLTEHIAVIDLMNLADALLFARDDLALAVALKSPLFGLDDDDLLKFAPNRKGSLREALGEYAQQDAKLKHALDRLEAFERKITRATPFAFFAWLLGGDGGRARIFKRLGPEANDALDEFLELALSYERKAPASLQGLMTWLRAADTEVKRDMEIARDEVRVMTVHGAKGLEASVVFLIDTIRSSSGAHKINLVPLRHGNAEPHLPSAVVWAGKKGDDILVVAEARAIVREESEDEYRRLLYVAMTRAADRLIVGGSKPGGGIAEQSWYELIQKGLDASDLEKQEIETSHGPLTRYTRAGDVEPSNPTDAAKADSQREPSPAWLRTNAPPEAAAPVLLRPSDPSDSDGHAVVTGEAQAVRAKALKRGVLVHRLLQSLPDVPVENRADMAKNYLARNALQSDGWNDDERNNLAAQVLALIGNANFASLFAQGSRAEVSIAGHIMRHGKPAIVSGQIDRLVVTPQDVLIVDYKTNHAPPSSANDAPQAYVRQLALYRDVLSRIYPKQPIGCVLVWTETAQLMEISPAALDAELQLALA